MEMGSRQTRHLLRSVSADEVKFEYNLDEITKDNVETDVKVKVEDTADEEGQCQVVADKNDNVAEEIELKFKYTVDEITQDNVEVEIEIKVKVEDTADEDGQCNFGAHKNDTAGVKIEYNNGFKTNFAEGIKCESAENKDDVDENSRQEVIFSHQVLNEHNYSRRLDLCIGLSPLSLVGNSVQRGEIRGKKSIPERNSQSAPVSSNHSDKFASDIDAFNTGHSDNQDADFLANSSGVETPSTPRNISDIVFTSIKPDPLVSVTNGSVFVCDYCQKVFSDLMKLRFHINLHLNERDELSMDNPRRHVARTHAKITYQCPTCGLPFPLFSYLEAHVRTHTDEKQLKCGFCHERSNSNSICFCTRGDPVNTNRSARNHGENEHQCMIYGERFRSAAILEHHIQTENRKKFECEFCDRIFKSSGGIAKHMLLHCETPFKCTRCDDRFDTRKKRQKHMALHPKKVLICDVCNEGFISPTKLAMHIRRHTGEKPFTCEYCDKRFFSKKYCKIHTKKHTEELRPLKCEYCGKSFVDLALWEKHIRNHAREKPFKCQSCGKSFASGDYWKEHIRTHAKKKFFKCGYCNKCFVSKDYCKIHILNTHNK